MCRQSLRSLFVAAMLCASTAGSAVAQPREAPPNVDLRPKFQEFKLNVRQQGQRGACQVHALVGVVEYQLARQGQRRELSEQFAMWAANEANDLKLTEGFNPDYLIAGLMRHGICERSLMPYVPQNSAIQKPSDEALDDAKARTSCQVLSIKHWSSEIGFGKKDFDQVIRRLDKDVPVTATFCWPAGLYDEEIVDEQHFINDKNIDGKSKDGHGVILVGYGLDSKLDGGGYFILRNSWGPKFADQGYAKVTFGFAKKYGIDAYVVSLR